MHGTMNIKNSSIHVTEVNNKYLQCFLLATAVAVADRCSPAKHELLERPDEHT